MRIQHNIMAMNAYRNYNNNTKALSGNLEKLSSGYKINRAGDDAAGLAISEKMRAQITGLDAAQKNVKDGISLVKTAEGAMQEIQDMLNRMDYLATQSANGTYQDEVDRENLQKEVEALKTEINRIADSANFNGIKLLDGSLGETTSTTAAVDKMDVGTALTISGVRDASASGKPAKAGVYEIDLSKFEGTATTAGASQVKIKVAGKTVAKASVAAAGVSKGITVAAADFKQAAASVTIGGVSFTVTVSGGKITLAMKTAPSAKFTTTMNVTVSGLKANGTYGNQAFPEAVTVKTEAVAKDDAKYAQGKFQLTASDIVDGSQIRIGEEVYTFAVGKNSENKKVQGVIDLTHMEENATGIAQEASRLLSKAAENNTWFKVTSDNNGNYVYLTERFMGADRKYSNDMAKTTTSNTDAQWNPTDAERQKDENLKVFVRFDKAGGIADKVSSTSTGGGLKLQIGDTSDDWNQMTVKVGDMHVKAMKNAKTGKSIADVDIGTQDGAKEAIDTIKAAINYVSGVRGDLGAIQNRLDHTANNLSVMAENIQDAESTIRDTDVADEMMKYVKNNILVQSAQAMLAQANQVPQGVLQLLG